MPPAGAVFLDHAGWFVSDIDAAAADFERNGFTLTPFTWHHTRATGNRCAMLHQGYIEILISAEGSNEPLAVEHRRAVARHAGAHLLAFSVSDTHAAHERLRASGFSPREPEALRRTVALEDGTQTDARFTVLRVPPAEMPEGRIQLLEQHTPELLWQPRYLRGANESLSLSGALLCVEDVGEAVARYCSFLDRDADGSRIDLDRGALTFATRARCSEMLGGLPVPDAPCIAAVELSGAGESGMRVIAGTPVVFT